eukprot:2492272-Rhodomonas_salina.1
MVHEDQAQTDVQRQAGHSVCRGACWGIPHTELACVVLWQMRFTGLTMTRCRGSARTGEIFCPFQRRGSVGNVGEARGAERGQQGGGS